MGVRQSRQFRFVQYCDIRDFCHFERSKIVGSADPLWSRETCLVGASNKRIPRLRFLIRKADDEPPLGMTEFFIF